MKRAHESLIPNSERNEDPAIMYLNEDLIEPDTIKQIKAMMNHRSLRHIRVMPDGHVGHGCCIGFTAKIDREKVIPAYVGGDIGCGILTYPLKKKKLNLTRVESIIRTIVPMGEGHHNLHEFPMVTESFLSRYIAQAQPSVDQLCMQNGLPPIHLDYKYFVELCTKIGAPVEATMCSFGTLGAGNHFIEINQDDVLEEYYLTIHSGSRNFGMKLFEYHNSLVDSRSRCLDGPAALEYCLDLICAQYLAKMNRHAMLQLILRELSIPLVLEDVIESIHNYIEFGEELILRKGAISAREGERCIVALNMRDGIAICRGVGNAEWNYSCAHGCGRAMSRSEARRRIKLKAFKKTMEGVVSTSVCEQTLDEAPQAYKEADVIMEAIQDTVTIESRLVSVMNLKGF